MHPASINSTLKQHITTGPPHQELYGLQGSGLIAANHGLPPEQGDAASDQRGQSQPSKTDLASTTSAHRSSQWSSSLAHRISSVMPAAPDSR